MFAAEPIRYQYKSPTQHSVSITTFFWLIWYLVTLLKKIISKSCHKYAYDTGSNNILLSIIPHDGVRHVFLFPWCLILANLVPCDGWLGLEMSHCMQIKFLALLQRCWSVSSNCIYHHTTKLCQHDQQKVTCVRTICIWT